MRASTSVIAGLVVLLATVVPVQAATWWIPAAAHADGAEGSVWRTDLQMHNFGATDETVTLALLVQGADNSALATTAVVQVAAADTVQVDDVLRTLFSYTGTAALKVDAAGDRLVVTSRTYNASASGTFGQAIPGVAADAVVVTRRSQDDDEYTTAYLLGLSGSNGQRVNLGWVNAGAAAITVSVELYDGTGARIAGGEYPELPYGQTQINNLYAHFRLTPVDNAYALVTAAGDLQPYASVVATGSNDPIYVAAQGAIDRAADLLLPAVVHAAGADNTDWRTDLWLLNPGASAAEVTLALWRQGEANPDPQTAEVQVAVDQQLALTDIVLEQFGRIGVQGALAITSNQMLLATSRTYNTAPEGTYGQFIPASSLGTMAGGGETLYLVGAAVNDDYRANLGLVATGDGGRIDLVLRAPTGEVLASKSRTLGANEQQQIGVGNLFGVGDLSGATVEATLATPAGDGSAFTAYLSTVDNGSSDPTYGQAARGYGEDPQLDNIDNTLTTITHVLSTAVKYSGNTPQLVDKTAVGCVTVTYDGPPAIMPPSNQCWYTEVDFDDCVYDFYGQFGISMAGLVEVDVNSCEDNEPSTLKIDVATILDTGAATDMIYRINSLLGLLLQYNGMLPEDAHLTGDLHLDLDGLLADAWVDLVWEGRLNTFELIPVGTLRMLLPYPELVGGVVEVVVLMDGDEWLFVQIRVGYYQVSLYVNIWTGEVRVS